MSEYCGYTIEADAAEQEILLALLSDFSFDSFEESELALKAYIPKADWLKEELEIEAFLNERSLSFEVESFEDKNWNEEWEKNFEPISVGKQLYVRANFHEAKAEYPYDLVITPQMSFGTGHHETTWLMLNEMLSLDFKGKKVLDMGCGTGILGIFASMLGAETVLAADIEHWALENCKENIARNNINNMQVIQADIDMINQSNYFDIIIANINRNVLIEHLPHYNRLLETKADLLLSGILKEDEMLMKDEIDRLGLSIANTEQKGNWIMIHCKTQ